MTTIQYRPSRSAAYVLTLVLLASYASSEDSTKGAQGKKTAKDGLSQRLAALTYVYDAEVTPAEYISKHPCVVGSWVYQSETDKHWIGDVHYISDNTLADSTRYVAIKLKVVKNSAVKVDMKKWQGRILLEKASPKAAVDDRLGNVLPFTVVGYSLDARRDGIIDLFRELPYKPMN